MLHYFQVVTAAVQPWWLQLLVPLVPLASGLLGKFLADGMKQVSTWYDSQSTAVKLVGSLLITGAVGFLNTHLALATPLGADLHGWTADVLGGILSALAASGIYRLDKNKQAAMQGKATAEQTAALANPKA